MIVIHKPEISIEGDEVVISSELLINDRKEILWYRLPAHFKKFLVTERLDAFVVGLLPLALKLGSNIEVEGAISSRLHYTLNHYLINALCLANPEFQKVQIHANTRDSNDLNVAEVAGTGLSCGVDSFATYYDHMNEETPYETAFFTFFNAGSHGDFGGDKARAVFLKRLNSVKKFAAKIGKEVIPVDSNLSDILKMNFQSTHTFRNISCILNLQRLFRNYYYASGYRVDHFELNKNDTSDADLFYLSMLSTESTNFFSSMSFITRMERTVFISNFSDTYNHLDVCTNPEGTIFKNCGACEKCLRTALTLELYGKLNFYKNIFNVDTYNKNKSYYIGKVIAMSKHTQIYKELYLKLKEKKKIQPVHYWFSFSYKLLQSKKIFKKGIKKKLK